MSGDEGDQTQTALPPAFAAPISAPEPVEQVLLARTPKPGETVPAWRLVTSVAWIAVAVAMGSVWKTSDQLGMSTWWLGPRGEPQPRAIQFLPFLPSILVLLAAVYNLRRLAWIGLAASAGIIAIGVVDLGYVAKLGVLEIAIGGAAAAVSIASFAGVLRPVTEPVAEPVVAPGAEPAIAPATGPASPQA